MQGISQKRYIRYRSTHDPPESAETGNLCRRPGPHGHMWPEPAGGRLGSVNGTFTTLTAPTSRLTSTPGQFPGVKTRHTSLNTYTGTRLAEAPGREAQPSRDRLQTPYGYHTPDNIPSFFGSVKTPFRSFPPRPRFALLTHTRRCSCSGSANHRTFRQVCNPVESRARAGSWMRPSRTNSWGFTGSARGVPGREISIYLPSRCSTLYTSGRSGTSR